MNEPCQAQVSDLSDNDLEQLSSGKGSRNNVSLSSNQAAPTTSAVQPVVVKGIRQIGQSEEYMTQLLSPTPAPAPQEPTPGGPGKSTSEFAATLGVVGANVVGVLALLGLIPAGDASSVSATVQGLAGGVAMAAANAIALWSYVRSRTQLKQAALQATVEREKVRIEAFRAPDVH